MKIYGAALSSQIPARNITDKISEYSKRMFEYEIRNVKYFLKQLFVDMKIGEKIKDSFYIQDEKLVKFNIKNPYEGFTHNNRTIYYHSHDYIDSSRLGEYLNIINKELKDAAIYVNNHVELM